MRGVHGEAHGAEFGRGVAGRWWLFDIREWWRYEFCWNGNLHGKILNRFGLTITVNIFINLYLGAPTFVDHLYVSHKFYNIHNYLIRRNKIQRFLIQFTKYELGNSAIFANI